MAPYIGSTPTSSSGLPIDYILPFFGVAIALLIGIMLFSSVTDTMDSKMSECAINGTEVDTERCQKYNETKENGFTIISIIPIVLFGVLIFSMFGKVFTKKVDHDNDPTTAPEIVKISLLMYVLLMLGLAHKVEKKDG